MIRQLSAHGLKFRTPKFVDSSQGYSEITHISHTVEFVIAEESTILLENPEIGASFSQVEVDVVGYVNEIPFVIYVTYKGRGVPMELKQPKLKRCGVVEVGIGGLLKVFKREKGGRYIEALRKYIEETSDGKSWVYHPRTEKARKQAEAEISEWQSQQKPPRSCRNVKFASKPKASQVFQPPALESVMPPKLTAQNYECVICHARWFGVSRHCENCDTHLFTRESGESAGET